MISQAVSIVIGLFTRQIVAGTSARKARTVVGNGGSRNGLTKFRTFILVNQILLKFEF